MPNSSSVQVESPEPMIAGKNQGVTNLRVTSLDEFQFLTCLKYKLWGSRTARLNTWKNGDYLVFTVNKSLAGLAKVVGDPFVSNTSIWDNDLFPHRISLEFIHAILLEKRPTVAETIRDLLTLAWGAHYGCAMVNQKVISNKIAEDIIQIIYSHNNDLEEIESNCDQHLLKAKPHWSKNTDSY